MATPNETLTEQHGIMIAPIPSRPPFIALNMAGAREKTRPGSASNPDGLWENLPPSEISIDPAGRRVIGREERPTSQRRRPVYSRPARRVSTFVRDPIKIALLGGRHTAGAASTDDGIRRNS
jgi:hypothetical protein